MIGRLQRKPQQKQVYVYHLLALDTPDIYLRDISLNKSVMHDSFMTSDAKWCTYPVVKLQ